VQIIRRGIPSSGTLHLTHHHLIFSHASSSPSGSLSTSSTELAAKSRPKELWITYPIIAFCTFRPTPPGSALSSSIRLRCRDFTFVTFQFINDQQARDVYESIKSLTCRVGGIDKLYAFCYRPQKPEKDFNGWEIYNAKAEWRRLGVSEKSVDRGWRTSTINVDYKVLASTFLCINFSNKVYNSFLQHIQH